MSFGRGRGGNGGSNRNRKSRGGFGTGGGGGGFNRTGRGGRTQFDHGPPDRVISLGHFSYACENDLICKVDIDDVPYFNAPIFLENKEQVGKIDEIFGTVRDYSVSVKLSENINANSFKISQKLFIDPSKLLPISRFLPKPPQPKGTKKKGPNGGVGGGRGRGGGGFRVGRGGSNHGGGFGRNGCGSSRGGGGSSRGGGGSGRGGGSGFNRDRGAGRGRW